MTCQEFWIEDDAASQAKSGHLAECAACAAEWNREQALRAGLRAMQGQRRTVEAPARVESRLVAAYRGHAGLQSGRLPRAVWVPAVTWLSAAAALGLVAVLLVRDREPKPVHRADPAAVHFAAARANPAAAVPETEVAEADFIPLPNVAELDAGEEVNLVRLEFPRSAMLELGFELSDEGDEDSVSADVMIGPDGVARAVRFLED